jgi:multidrug efflux system outer membrane protein
MNSLRWAVSCALIALVGCAGFPTKPKPVQFSSEAPLSLVGEAGGVWPAKDWWTRYQDPTLDQLITAALDGSPTLATAHARFDSARESVRLAGAATGAQVGLQGDAYRQRLSDNGITSAFPPSLLPFHWYDTFDLGLQARYTFDWWGKQRAIVESAMDQAHAAQAERSAAAIALASAVADTYFGWQADQTRLAVLRERRDTVEREGRIAAERVQSQLDPADSLQRAKAALAAVDQDIASLQGSAALRVVALAALVGRSPDKLPTLAAKPLPSVPVSLPNDVKLDLIARRADITASRWRVESAERSRESVRADFYPDISINALANLNSLSGSKLLEYGSRAPEAGIALHLPIFDAGRLKAQYRGAQASIDAAVAAYDETVLDAARDVATQAATRERIAAERAQRSLQVDASLQLRDSAAARVRQGVADVRTALNATDAWIQQRDELARLDAAALSADINLQRALGGGYDVPAPFADSHSTTQVTQP